MPAPKRQRAHSYSVYVAVYTSEEVKQRIESNQEDFAQPGLIHAQLFYHDRSLAQAERAFARAALFAMNNPLAFEVVMTRDSETIIRVKAHRF